MVARSSEAVKPKSWAKEAETLADLQNTLNPVEGSVHGLGQSTNLTPLRYGTKPSPMSNAYGLDARSDVIP